MRCESFKSFELWSAVLWAVLCVVAFGSAQAQSRRTVVHNVRGYSIAGAEVERFGALVIVDGRIEQRLSLNQPVPQILGATRIDGGGRTLLPGLIDAHGHVLEFGRQRQEVDLRGSASLADAMERVRRFAAADKNQKWVRGRGWNQVLWAGRQFPTAAQLDTVIADRPALLARVDGHAIWVNTAALNLAGITKATRDPPGGQIIRDASGEPTGVLVDAATALVERHLPATTDMDIQNALEGAMRELAALGLTGVHDAGLDERTYRAYESLGASGRLPIRIYAMLADSPAARPLIAKGPMTDQFDGRLHMRSIKAWVDGALGSRGAALLADYSDQAKHRGLLLYSPADLQSLSTLAARHGWQLNVHAIGDAGNRIALDTIERTFTPSQRTTLRPRIEHAQVIDLEDIPRFAKLDVIASIQPTHATSDMNMAEDRVGAQRIRGAYAWRKLLDNKGRLAGGSDFPVELANPFHGLYAAVTRKSRAGDPALGWYPNEKLTRAEALRLFTTDAAYAGHAERNVGGLQVGQWADFILIDRDYFTVPEDQIDDIVVTDTYVSGRPVTARAN